MMDTACSHCGGCTQGVLYGALVAASEKGSVAALADVLNVDINGLCEALSVAVRLGFGQRLPPVHGMSLYKPA